MDGSFGDVGAVLGTDRHVAQLARPCGRAGAVNGKGKHVGWRILSSVLTVERLDALLVDYLDGKVPVGDPGGSERRCDRFAQISRHVAQVNRHWR